MDRIVFNQTELDSITAAHSTVALCDNNYVISPTPCTQYIAIGEVSAVVECSAIEAISMGMSFVGFNPEFSGKCIDKAGKPESVGCVSTPVTSFASSFKSSFATSFTTSIKSSFATSFTTSFSAMHEYEYQIATSFNGSFSGSFKNVSSFAAGIIKKKQIVRKIAVNGYGLNLI